MSLIVKPFKEDAMGGRPGVELFTWRSVLSFIFFIVSIIVFYFQLSGMHSMKNIILSVCSLVLLFMTLYHVCFILFLKTIRYEITEDELFIKALLLKIKIKLSDIKGIENLSNSPIELKKRSIFSYIKEAPQIVYPVAQLGSFPLAKYGAVTFISFVNSLKNPYNLIFIKTAKNKTYAFSPDNVDEFISRIKLK